MTVMSALNESDKILLAMSSGVAFAETYFRAPHDPTSPLKLHPYQRRFMNFVDFGYDIETGIKPRDPPQYVIMKTPRQFGKTTAVAALIATQLLRYPGCCISVASIGEKRANDLLGLVKYFIINSPFADMIAKSTKETIELSNGSELHSHPQSASIRGISNDWMYFDEAGYMTDRFILEDGEPTVTIRGRFLNAGTPDIILTSTPPETMDSRFVRLYLKGLNMAEGVCLECGYREYINSPDWENMKVTEFGIEHAVCPRCGSTKIERVFNTIVSYSPSPFDHPKLSKEAILAKLDREGNTPAVRREVLGEIVSNASTLIRKEWIDFATDQRLMNYPTPQSTEYRYCMGIDFGRVKDATVFCIGHKEDNTIVLDHITVIPGHGGHTYDAIRAQFLSLAYKFTPYIFVPDSTGIGNPLVEQMQKDLIDLSYNGVSGSYNGNDYFIPPNPGISPRIYSNKAKQLGFYFDYKSKMDLIDNLINLFQLHFIRIPPPHIDKSTATLHRELMAFNYTTTKNGRIVYGSQAEHDDSVIALALMAWGLRESSITFTEAYYGGEDEFTI